MLSFKELAAVFNDYLGGYSYPSEPSGLYKPVEYIMSLGGKRIRPLLCLASYNLYHNNVMKAADAAMAVEVFHNFSLVHDDLMDNADIRRGKASVHKKYDDNTAILSGDVMLIMSYQCFEKYPEKFYELNRLFSKTAIEVCEGQRMDMDFENMERPPIDDYIKMISLKTSVLIACALQMGAVIASAPSKDAEHLYAFGKNIGIAFQVQDDLLDSFGKDAMIGKKVGGDILQRKKTYLYLKSLDLLSQEQAIRLKNLYSEQTLSDAEHIHEVKTLFKAAHVDVHAQELKLVYQQLAMSHLDAVDVEESKKQVLRSFAENLLDRSY